MKISEIIKDKYKLRIPPTVYYDLLADVVEAEEEQEPKIGHWIKISPADIFECSKCGQNVMTSDICAYKFCHGCGAKMVEPQESEDKE